MRKRNLLALVLMTAIVAAVPTLARAEDKAAADDRPVIQVALLLDTSNSMDGLINQAKTHLWRIVNEFATAKQNGRAPVLQVALFEYGNDGLPAKDGHIRCVLPLTDDLDGISEQLFALKTNGGQEYCGQVIQEATRKLNWSKDTKVFKAIFIAGNEAFTQGSVDYAEACREAIKNGVIVNTIFCGGERNGINGKWNDGAALADGSFITIDQNQTRLAIAAPQDAELAKLNEKFNRTFVGYGAKGEANLARQAQQDANAKEVDQAVLSARVQSKASNFYSNASWDLIDRSDEKDFDIDKIAEEDLPEEMKKMTKEERLEHIEKIKAEREEIKKKIQSLSKERERYIADEMKKHAEEGEKTLDDAIVETVRTQAAKSGFEFESEE